MKNDLTYNPVMFELTHWMPCQPSKHGSPPIGTHPGRGGQPKATYKLFTAVTEKKTNKKTKEKKRISQKIKIFNINLHHGF